MSDSDRLSFEEACKELQLSEEELEQKVAGGEIAAIKDGDSVFFKREVVENYKQRHDLGEPTVLVSDEEIHLLEDMEEEDLGDIDFGIEIEEPAGEKAAEPGTDKVSATSPGELDLSLEEIDLSADSGASAPGELASQETVLNLDGILEDDTEGTTPVSSGGLLEGDGDSDMGQDTLLDTDILDLGEGEETDTFELDTTEDTLLDATEEGTLLRGGGARVMQMKRKKSHAAWTAVLAFTGLCLLAPLGVLLAQTWVETLEGPVVTSAEAFVSIELKPTVTPEDVRTVVDFVLEGKPTHRAVRMKTLKGKEFVYVYGDLKDLNLRAVAGLDPVKTVEQREEGTFRWIGKYNFLRSGVESVADLVK